MSAVTAVLRVGSLIHHDGGRFTVVEFAGRRLLMRANGSGQLRQVDVAWLLAHPTTSVSAPEGVTPVSAAVVLDSLDDGQTRQLREQVGHVQEVLTGYRLGAKELAGPDEPRAEYAPGTAKMGRYQAKAAELGVGVSTVRRWVQAFTDFGPQGLVPAGTGRGEGPWGRTDPRWVEACQTVLAGHVNASRPTRALVLAQVQALLEEQHGPGVVPVPSRTTGYELLRELTRGTNAFTGSAKGKRSIAGRPPGVYGRLRATRPGEYVLLDTTRLDVYAMEPMTCRWVQVELTAAMDLYSRTICGLRVTPVSTKAADVAGVLYETLRPAPRDGHAQLACGVPGTVVVDARRLVDAHGQPLLPSVAAETVVFDRGAIYLSEHMHSVCARFGISLQPARPRRPTDKSPLERWFKTLAEGLLVALPGYKGSDVHSRGLDVEEQAFFFLDELEAVIREWINVYHQRPHEGLSVAEIPGLELSPLEMFEHGVNRAGHLTILDRPDLAYDFLKVRWTRIQHYGVEIDTLRYDARVLVKYRNATSPFTGVHAGRWPFAVDPGDVTRIFFQDPADNSWHTLWWEHAADLGRPMSSEALAYARRLAAATHRFPDTKRAVADLLERWGVGLTANASERRMSLRLSAQRLQLVAGQDATAPPEEPEADPAPQAPRQRDGKAVTAVDADGPAAATTPPRSAADAGADFYADVMDSA
ncbi:DDE-type integrase/transposase/recombinase [Catellatospora chokoriensis]|uniref:Integrase/transposase n=1 Tax=Catellatospora chokoriensis TaxID=310353 RepID=A0A8J3K7H3_9ACTN|nr:DDE-type integrase/transposase/recombinase [Catellatospora chokoriensis]GIF94013.1 integrase/transposase [Catellatospora chokoriensis]